MRRRLALAAFLVILSTACGRAAEPAVPSFTGGESAMVRAVTESGALILADGRQVDLVDIDFPMLGTRNESDLGRAALAALRQFTGGSVELRFAGAAQDRYGHVLAQVFARDVWVQGELLRRGLARAHGRADARTGLAAMLAIEAEARQAKRGLWARAYYGVREADAIGRDAGRFLIVEGTVAQASAVSGGVYVNFGADWHSAFSLHLDSAAVRLCRAAGLDPLKLAGAHLRVRGFVEGGRRPLIEITFAEQIERLE